MPVRALGKPPAPTSPGRALGNKILPKHSLPYTFCVLRVASRQSYHPRGLGKLTGLQAQHEAPRTGRAPLILLASFLSAYCGERGGLPTPCATVASKHVFASLTEMPANSSVFFAGPMPSVTHLPVSLLTAGLGVHCDVALVAACAMIYDRHGLLPLDVPGDGNCSFAAVQKSLGLEKSADELRQEAVSEVARRRRADPAFAIAAAAGLQRDGQVASEPLPSPEAYLEAAMESSFYVGEAEICALMERLAINITVHYVSTGKQELVSYPIPHPNGSSLPTVHLLRVNDNHFLALCGYDPRLGYLPQQVSPRPGLPRRAAQAAAAAAAGLGPTIPAQPTGARPCGESFFCLKIACAP